MLELESNWWSCQLGSISSMCLRAAFTHTDPKGKKNDNQVKQLFALMGSVLVKALRKHVDKIEVLADLFITLFQWK